MATATVQGGTPGEASTKRTPSTSVGTDTDIITEASQATPTAIGDPVNIKTRRSSSKGAAGNIKLHSSGSKFQCRRHYILGAIVGGLLVAIAVYILKHGSKKHTPVVGCHTKAGINISSMHHNHHKMPFIPLTPIGLNLTSSSNVSLSIKGYDNTSVLYLNLVYSSGINWLIRGMKDYPNGTWLQTVMFNYTVDPIGSILRLNFVLNGMLLKVHLTEDQGGPTHTLTFWSEQFQPQGLFLEAECAEESEYYYAFWGCYSVKSDNEKLNKQCLMGPLTCGFVYVILLIASLLLVITLLAIYQKIDPQALMSGNKYSRDQIQNFS